MRFIVENFGPIERADVTLKDFNIFIGKNASGKSYLMYLIWTLLSVEPNRIVLRNLLNDLFPNELIRRAFNDNIESKDKIETEISVSFERLVLEIFKRFNEVWGKSFENLLKDVFIVDDIRELIRRGKEKAKITVCDNEGKNRISFEICEDGLRSWVDDDTLKFLKDELVVVTTIEKLPEESESYVWLHYGLYIEKNDKRDFEGEVLPIKENSEAFKAVIDIFMWLFDGYYPYVVSFIAPDGRTGLLRTTDALKYVMLSEYTAMTETVFINKIDRIFIRDFETMYPTIKNKEISKYANFIEEKLNVKYVFRREQPRYTMQIEGVEMPIQRTPSGYREIAPIVYAIRYKLDEGSIVFIEEPEAHLHPDGQIVITRALAGLSKHCCVIITTHSVTILDEISNLLRLSSLPKETKQKLGYEDWEGLNPENVGIFLFRDGEVEEIEIYEDGIEETDLDRVMIEISNMHAKVDVEYEHTKEMRTQR